MRENIQCGCGMFRCSDFPCPHWIEGKHHDDGSVACKTNHRSPEEEVEWQEEHAKWKEAQAKLPDLAAVMIMLDEKANPFSFDGHDIFMFVEECPEEAAICLTKMYSTLSGISVGKEAMGEIPVPKARW